MNTLCDSKMIHSQLYIFKFPFPIPKRLLNYVVPCNILIACATLMKLVSLMKVCLTETYNRVRVSKHLSDMFPVRNGLKQGDSLPPLLFNFALEFAIRRVQVNQHGLKLNGTHRLLVYADDVNILGWNLHSINKDPEALIVCSWEIWLEVNDDKTKCMVMFRDQNAGRSHNIKTDN